LISLDTAARALRRIDGNKTRPGHRVALATRKLERGERDLGARNRDLVRGSRGDAPAAESRILPLTVVENDTPLCESRGRVYYIRRRDAPRAVARNRPGSISRAHIA